MTRANPSSARSYFSWLAEVAAILDTTTDLLAVLVDEATEAFDDGYTPADYADEVLGEHGNPNYWAGDGAGSF